MKRMLWLSAPIVLAFGACVDKQPTAPGSNARAISPFMVMASTGTETRITTNMADQVSAAISGDRIVWEERRSSLDSDIYLYDLSTDTETQITTNTAKQERPKISGDKIVWTDGRNGNGDIYLYDLSTSTETQLTTGLTGLANQGYPDIDGNRIVWNDEYSATNDIYLYDLSTSTLTQITTNPYHQMHPAISGDKIVWEDWRNGSSNLDIYLYDLSTSTERQITTNTAQQLFPDISGDKIVWEDDRNGNWDIYLYDLSTSTERQITTNTAQQNRPAISGDKIVWHDSRDGAYVIYMYDLSTNTETRISATSSVQTNPAVSGDSIVWQDLRSGNWDIYLYTEGPASNTAPTADAGGPYTRSEGSAVSFDGSTSSDPESDPLTYAWNFGDGSTGTGVAPSHTYSDNGTYTVTLVVNDGALDSDAVTTTATISNAVPDLDPITPGTMDPIALTTSFSVGADFTDPGSLDTHTAAIDWGDGNTTTGTITEANGSGSVSGTHLYTAAGVYTVTITLTDKDGAPDTSIHQYVVIFDASTGFATGTGWIASPAGAYIPDASLSGRATFGFASKYRRGANVPTGTTEFRFQAEGMVFYSNVQEWLVVNQGGTNAQLKGTGTINGEGTYKFMIWATDNTPDTFRIRIWEEIAGVETTVYDNGSDQVISGGSIRIHAK